MSCYYSSVKTLCDDLTTRFDAVNGASPLPLTTHEIATFKQAITDTAQSEADIQAIYGCLRHIRAFKVLSRATYESAIELCEFMVSHHATTIQEMDEAIHAAAEERAYQTNHYLTLRI